MRGTMHREGRLAAVAVLVAAMLLFTTPADQALAQASDKDPYSRKALSRKSFDRAELLYRQAKFKLAVAAYYKAMSYYRHPAYLFNIAQCHRNLRRYSKARFFYRLYLSEATDTSNRAEVVRFISAMESKITEQKRLANLKARRAAATVPRKAPRAAPRGKPYHQRWWFWTGISVGLAALGAATYTGTQALMTQRKWDDNRGAPADDPNLKRRGQTFRTVTDVLIGVAVVSAGAAIIGAIVVAHKKRGDRRGATIVPSCGQSGCGVWVSGRF